MRPLANTVNTTAATEAGKSHFLTEMNLNALIIFNRQSTYFLPPIVVQVLFIYLNQSVGIFLCVLLGNMNVHVLASLMIKQVTSVPCKLHYRFY